MREGRSYNDAVTALNSLQSNFAVVDAIRKSGRGMNVQAIPEMVEWLRRIGYKPHDFDSLNAIHIAGTKGKGSTAAFVSSILSQYLSKKSECLGQKIGLYTSPHLRFVRERIQINNEPISEAKFAESFFEVWDRLEAAQSRDPTPAEQPSKPVYFRYLTLMALHLFLKEDVRTTVIECGIGGEYDSTNILQTPTVTGITSLGIDHTAMLGSTIEEIAWHKAGIMKRGAPAFTAPQPPQALAVLQSRAAEKAVDLKVAAMKEEINNGSTVLGLDGDFQKVNASLAVELAMSHLQSLGFEGLTADPLPAEFRQGLRDVKWAGRCETRKELGLTWHLDGGHTTESIRIAGGWFRQEAVLPDQEAVHGLDKSSAPRILLFNQQTRAGVPLLEELLATVKEGFTHAIFCSNVTFSSTGYKADLVSMNVNESSVEELTVQKELAAAWRDLVSAAPGESQAYVVRTIEEAVAKCRAIAQEWHARNDTTAHPEVVPKALATGSLHLIGGLIEVLETQKQKNSI